MSYLNDTVLDQALSYISTNADHLYICSSEPSTHTQASSTYALGTKASPAFGSVTSGDSSGRKLPITAISDGSVTGNGSAAYWAITKDASSVLLAAGALASSQGVTSGNTFTLTSFDIEIPDPT